MGKETMSDFVVDSNRHCFVCLSQITTLTPEQNQASLPLLAKPINSLYYLSRYLKMDLKNVFLAKEHVAPELLAKVEKARLKVELCEECTCLNKIFSEVYRKFEKLGIELQSTLRLIREKFVSADATNKLHRISPNSQSDWDGLFEVVDVLREEAVQKSSRKLADTPRVKIQNLSKNEIRAKQFKLGNNFRSDSKIAYYQDPITNFVPDLSCQQGVVKMESTDDKCLSDIDGNNFSNDVDSNSGTDPKEDLAGIREEKIKKNMDDNIVTEDGKMLVDQNLVSLMTRNGVGTEKCKITSKTRKRKCNGCRMEFNSSAAFTLHYQAVHLNLRYKCVACNKLFAQNSSLRLHQRTSRSCSSTGSATKFNCHLCDKTFARKHHVEHHLEGTHYKLQKYECDHCQKKFNTVNNLRAYQNRVHSGMK